MLITNIYLLVCSVFGLSYGLNIMFSNKPPAYFSLILFSMASQVYVRIYAIINIICYDGLPDIFNIGFLGYASFLLFLFFANYGQIDTLVDDKSKNLKKYRIIPLILPILELIAAFVALFMDYVHITVRISYFMLTIMGGLAGYLNLKHIIIPDVDGGIVRSIKGYNITAIIVELLTLSEIGFTCFNANNLVIIVHVVLGILLVIMMPLLNREVQKWTQ